MPSEAAIRASARARARLGQACTLNGVACGFVHVEHGVRLVLNDVETARTVVTIGREHNPVAGKTLVHPTEGTMVLDVKVADNGASKRFVVIQ
jgi:hypothetical protein